MKSQNVNFTGFMVTKGYADSQLKLQRILSAKLIHHNTLKTAENAKPYASVPNYISLYLSGSDNKQKIIHATGDDVATLLAVTKGLTQGFNPTLVENLIFNNKIPVFGVDSVLGAIAKNNFNEQALKLLESAKAKIRIKLKSKDASSPDSFVFRFINVANKLSARG